ncbi:hypothetical protein HK096_004226 [Nowakowskiella sp. JEL0078]|nr:hypothetical protein HK096_004226 [Nowakowskiella sp. JEL0078]
MLDLRIENDPLQAIGTRMLYQLIGEQGSWSSFVRKFRINPDDLIDKLIANHNNNLLQKPPGLYPVDGLCLINLALLSRRSNGPFVIIVFAASVSVPFDEFLDDSYQKRGLFASCNINTSRKSCNGSKNMCISHDCLSRYNDFDSIILDDILHEVVLSLKDRYPEWVDKASELMALVFRLILTYAEERNTKLKVAGGEFTVDGATQFGLVRFLSNVDGSNSEHLICAYAFLCSVTNDNLLSCWDYNYLQSRQNKNDTSKVPLWQPFEDFLGRFRVMKSLINPDGANIIIDSLHSGIFLNGDFHNFPRRLEYRL